MNIKGFRRMLLGEKMPDRNDPKYKERYEREGELPGRRFAKATRIDKAAARGAGLCQRAPHPVPCHRIWLFVAAGLAWNIYRLTVVYHRQPVKRTATEMQDSILRERHPVLRTVCTTTKRTMTMSILEKINFRQPKYMLPAILYLPLLARRTSSSTCSAPKRPKCRTPR